MDYEDFAFKTRLESAKEAITRVRFSFLLNLVASLVVTLAVWNGYLSWYRYFVLIPHCVQCAADDPTRVAQEQLIKSWVNSLVVNITPLGISFGVSDLAFVGPAGLLVLSVILVYCARKENHAIAYLLRDSKSKPPELQSAIYYGVSSHLVFLSVSRDDSPISDLDYKAKFKQSTFLWRAFDLLIFAPVITVAIIIAADLASVFLLHGTLRQNHPILWANLLPPERRQFFAMEAVPLLLGVGIWSLCNGARRYSEATVQILRAYSDLISKR